jgi:hypothetical protein
MRRLSLLVLVVVFLGTLPASAGDRSALPALPARTESAETAPTLLSLLWGSLLDLLAPRSIVEGLGAEMDPFGRLSPTTTEAPPPDSASAPAEPEALGATIDPFG